MSRPRASAERLDAVARCGTLLVAALVIALPLAMALCPADSLGESTAAGVGAGTGDVVAAALSGFARDVQGVQVLPALEPCQDPVPALVAAPFAAEGSVHAFDATAPPTVGSRATMPGDTRAGPTDLGHQLLL